MWDENHRVLNQIRITGSLPMVYRKLTEDIPKILSGNDFCLILKGWALNGISSVFRKYSNASPNIFRQIHGDYTVNLTNQLFVPYGKYLGIRVLNSLYVKSAVRIFCHMDLTIG